MLPLRGAANPAIMNDWSHGYNVSQGYTFNTYRELSPEWLDAAARLNGVLPPQRVGGRFRYVEFGSGQGVGLCLLAAAYPDCEFVGIDFLPEHIAHATQLAHTAALDNVRFVEADFLALGAAWPAELGRFDYAVLHGIISWVPVDVRQALTRCLEAATLPGALVYVSYNCLPGWLGGMPFQHMLSRMARTGNKPGSTVMQEGVALFEALQRNGAAVATALPQLSKRIDSAKVQSPAYLVQEYLHREWHPLWFSTVSDELAGAKLTHVGSATIADVLLPRSLADALRDQILAEPDPVMRQELIDLATNASFRRDLFCRGARRRTVGMTVEEPALRLLTERPEGRVEVATSFGNAQLPVDLVGLVYDLLGERARSLPELLAAPPLAGRPSDVVVSTVVLLLQGGRIAFARSGPLPADPAHRINDVLIAATAAGASYADLAMPVLGGILRAGDVEMMVLDELRRSPAATPAQLAQALVARLARLGRNVQVEGHVAQPDELVSWSEALVDKLLRGKLPLWHALGALDPDAYPNPLTRRADAPPPA